jgi:hypothetical protein
MPMEREQLPSTLQQSAINKYMSCHERCQAICHDIYLVRGVINGIAPSKVLQLPAIALPRPHCRQSCGIGFGPGKRKKTCRQERGPNSSDYEVPEQLDTCPPAVPEAQAVDWHLPICFHPSGQLDVHYHAQLRFSGDRNARLEQPPASDHVSHSPIPKIYPPILSCPICPPRGSRPVALSPGVPLHAEARRK